MESSRPAHSSLASRIIDADTHVWEPTDLWTTRLPRAHRDNAPRVIDTDIGKRWSFPGGETAMITPLSNAVGQSSLQWKLSTHKGYDEELFRPGAWDPAERLKDMDIDGVDVHVLFPTFVMHGARLFGRRDRDLQIACVRAYNDWLSEFCQHNLGRLVGNAMVPMTGVDDAIAEATRVAGLPGLRGVVMTSWPDGRYGATAAPDYAADDPFFSALEDLDLAAVIHVGFGVSGEGGDATETESGGDTWERMMSVSMMPSVVTEKLAISFMPLLSHFILGGVLARHPRLRLGGAEVGAGWVPFFLEQTEDNYTRHRFWANGVLARRPSQYWFEQCFTTFQIDTLAIRERDNVGRGNLMWSSDYPHAGSDFPQSIRTIESQVRGVPVEDRELMLWANAARLYGLTLS